MAAFAGFPAALCFSTGYHANLSVVQALADADTLIVSDAHIHASMIDAGRLTRATVTVTGHNDVAAVARALADRSQRRALVLTETIYSVLGDAAPLAELAELVTAEDAVLIADEAHALGVGGPGGRGLLAAAGLAGRPDVVATGTLSKSFGSQGGLVLGSPAVRRRTRQPGPAVHLRHRAGAGRGRRCARRARGHRGRPGAGRPVRRNAAALADAAGVPRSGRGGPVGADAGGHGRRWRRWPPRPRAGCESAASGRRLRPTASPGSGSPPTPTTPMRTWRSRPPFSAAYGPA